MSYWRFDMRFRTWTWLAHVVWSCLYVSGAVDRSGYCYSWKFEKNNKRLEIVPQKDFIIANMVTHKLRRAWQLVHVMWVYCSCFDTSKKRSGFITNSIKNLYQYIILYICLLSTNNVKKWVVLEALSIKCCFHFIFIRHGLYKFILSYRIEV